MAAAGVKIFSCDGWPDIVVGAAIAAVFLKIRPSPVLTESFIENLDASKPLHLLLRSEAGRRLLAWQSVQAEARLDRPGAGRSVPLASRRRTLSCGQLLPNIDVSKRSVLCIYSSAPVENSRRRAICANSASQTACLRFDPGYSLWSRSRPSRYVLLGRSGGRQVQPRVGASATVLASSLCASGCGAASGARRDGCPDGSFRRGCWSEHPQGY